jgi:two-component system cell cycle response regulator DivK
MTTPRTILVVDDFEWFRSMFGALLEECGYRVLETANGLEAVEIAFSSCPDLILMDGLAATKRIRENEGACRNVPILAISADGP